MLRWSLLAALGVTAHFACAERETSGGEGGGGSSGDPTGPVVGDGSGGLVTACADPQPLLVAGQETGFVSCGDGGPLHRPEQRTCPSLLPRDVEFEPVNPHPSLGGAAGAESVLGFDECTRDSDCEGPYAHCVHALPIGPDYLKCVAGCVSDADCGEDELCLCGDPAGSCVPATCKTDADCDGECLGTEIQGCSELRREFACVSPEDMCLADADCEEGTCDGRRCVPYHGCGRPFLVEQVERLAEIELRGDWLEASPGRAHASSVAAVGGMTVEDLTDAERARLAEHWARAGLMEHASIAAFARFTLQLLALGAPVELVELSNAATADETKHARRCFGQASRFADRVLGPSALGMHGALGEVNLAEVVELVLLEGCVGETVAALEAGAARDRATDAEVRALLGEIADDEARHAELAWSFVRWALDREPRLAGLCARVFGALGEEAGSERAEAAAPGGPALRLEAFGLLDDATRKALRSEALRSVVLPCGAALLGRVPSRALRSAQPARV